MQTIYMGLAVVIAMLLCIKCFSCLTTANDWQKFFTSLFFSVAIVFF